MMLELGSMNPGGEARLWSDSSLHIASHSAAVCGPMSPPAGHSRNSPLRLSVNHIAARDCDQLARLELGGAKMARVCLERFQSFLSLKTEIRDPGGFRTARGIVYASLRSS